MTRPFILDYMARLLNETAALSPPREATAVSLSGRPPLLGDDGRLSAHKPGPGPRTAHTGYGIARPQSAAGDPPLPPGPDLYRLYVIKSFGRKETICGDLTLEQANERVPWLAFHPRYRRREIGYELQ